MSLGQFSKPPEEVVEETVGTENGQANDELLKEILKEHLQMDNPEDEDAVKSLIMEPSYSTQDENHALKELLSFTKKQNTTNKNCIRLLDRYKQELTSIERNSLSRIFAQVD